MEYYANNYMKWPEEAQLCPFEIFAIILKPQELRRLPYLMSSKTLQVSASSFSQTKCRRLDYISLNINRKSFLSPLFPSLLSSPQFSSSLISSCFLFSPFIQSFYQFISSQLLSHGPWSFANIRISWAVSYNAVIKSYYVANGFENPLYHALIFNTQAVHT